jgi:L-alanine-DL-glutamate epimerase-like enolase superfamily enzyme
VASENRVELLALPVLSASTFSSQAAIKKSLFIAMRAIAENVYSGLKEIHLVASSRDNAELLVEVVTEAESLGSGEASPGGVFDAATESSADIAEAAEALAGSFGPEGGDHIRQFLVDLERACSSTVS